MSNNERDPGPGGMILKVLAGVAAVLGLIYVATGRREEDSPFIPNVIEDKIDRLVAFLDQRVGKQWVNRGLDGLATFIARTYPEMSMVLGVVFEAEQQGRRLGWQGTQKRSFALQRLRPAYA